MYHVPYLIFIVIMFNFYRDRASPKHIAAMLTDITRHRASTSMYSLTFRVRVTTPGVWTKCNGARSRRVDVIAGEGSPRRHV